MGTKSAPRARRGSTLRIGVLGARSAPTASGEFRLGPPGSGSGAGHRADRLRWYKRNPFYCPCPPWDVSSPNAGGKGKLTCRCPQTPPGRSRCVPAPGAEAGDPGFCLAVSSPLLSRSVEKAAAAAAAAVAAAPSGKLSGSSPSAPRLLLFLSPSLQPPLFSSSFFSPPFLPLLPAGGAGEQGCLHHLPGELWGLCGSEAKPSRA